MDRRRFLTFAGSALVIVGCDDSPSSSVRDSSVPTGNAVVGRPTNALITRWSTDSFSRGSYSYLSSGSHPQDRDDLRSDVAGRLFFAGEATSRAFPATVHGAVLEGRAAAERIDQEGGPAQNVVVVVDLGAPWIHGVSANPLTELADEDGIGWQANDFDSIVVRDNTGFTVADDEVERAEDRLREAIDSADPNEFISDLRDEAGADQSPAERLILEYVRSIEIDHEFGVDPRRLAMDEGDELDGGDAVVPDRRRCRGRSRHDVPLRRRRRSTFREDPRLFGWKSSGPLGIHPERSPVGRFGCPDLEVVDHVETDGAEQAQPRRELHVELDTTRVVERLCPVESTESEVVSFECESSWRVTGRRCTHHCERMVPEEYEAATRT